MLSLPDAHGGDQFEVSDDRRTFNAQIITVNGGLYAVVDYNIVGPVEKIPEPWSLLHWKKVA